MISERVDKRSKLNSCQFCYPENPDFIPVSICYAEVYLNEGDYKEITESDCDRCTLYEHDGCKFYY